MTREEWIQKFGSERLKRGVEQGYPMNELFFDEFIEMEMTRNGLPIGLYENFSSVRKIDSPTLEQLDLAERIAEKLSNYRTDVSIVKCYPYVNDFFNIEQEDFVERIRVEVRELGFEFFVNPNESE